MLTKDDHKKIWFPIRKELKELLASGVIKSQAAMARELDISQPTVHTWFSSRNSVPRAAAIDKVRQYLAKFRPTRTHHTPPEAIQRKADIIAQNLETTLPLMEWFVNQGSEEDRDLLRKVLGTDLSYQTFDAARALLTEMHHKRVLEERKHG
jgi:DNA-binding transcriptional regulator YdaS (Cro superfamily)